jgi:pre-rRNA-processing protein TSR2
MSAMAMEEFRAGVTACLRSWSAFRTAVESGWGGGARECQEKADELRRSIFRIMDGSKCPLPNFDITDLADNLAIYVEEEFSVTLEDKSELQVAEAIFNMYEGCCNGDPTFARQMVAHADSAIGFNSQFPVQVQTTEHDDEDDEDMVDSQTQTQHTPQLALNPPVNSMVIPTDYNAQPLFGTAIPVHVSTAPVRQLGDTAPEQSMNTPIEMDDDGFASVKPKGRRRN